MSPFLTFLTNATRKASRFLSRDYLELEQLQSPKRPTHSFVSVAKTKVKDALCEELLRYPNSSVIESLENIDPSKAIHFVINPLDGELNLSRAIPFFAIIVVGYEYKDNQLLPKACVAVFPALGEIIYSEIGAGTFSERVQDNSSHRALRLRVSATQSINNAIIAHNNALNLTDHHIRSWGCDIYSACLVASGKADIFIAGHIKEATQLATTLIIRESGGRTYENKELYGKQAKFIATNSSLNIDLLAI